MEYEHCDVEEFPGYTIWNNGDIWNEYSGGILTHSPNQQGIPTVGFRIDGRGEQHRRSVPLLVAQTFLPNPPRDDFTTPIHLDGDRTNCRADNLMWRPRWFAIKYHQERREDPFPDWHRSFELIDTCEIFDHPRDCAIIYGILEATDQGIFSSIMNSDRRTFPYGFSFRWV